MSAASSRPKVLHGRRVLVTGTNGFVGRHVTAVLAGRQAVVLGIGIEDDARLKAVQAWKRADVTDFESLEVAFADLHPDAVIHLAGQASAGLSFHEPERTFRANTIGTWNVLEAARRRSPGARVLIVGSGEAYGPQPTGSSVPESSPLRPVSPYAFSKAAADAIADTHGRIHGLDVVRTRSFSHAGPGQSERFALPSFAAQIAALERAGSGGVLRVGNLTVVRDILDVRDVAECYVRLLESGGRGQAYNVCSGVGVALDAVVSQLVALARVPVRIEIDADRVRPADVPYLVGDATRVREATAWRPRYSLPQTLRDVLDHARRVVPGV